MTDRYEKIRKALAMGPTPGPWSVRYDYVVQAKSFDEGRLVPIAQPYGLRVDGIDLFANARLIAACDPDTIRELLDRLEAAESDGLEQARLLGMSGEREAALMAQLEDAEKERDALRSLVVMRFDHDHPPQFTQGYDTHELAEPVTAEHCRWFVAEITRLRAKIEAMEKQEPIAWTTELALRHGASALGFDACVTNLWGEKGVPLCALPGAKGEEK